MYLTHFTTTKPQSSSGTVVFFEGILCFLKTIDENFFHYNSTIENGYKTQQLLYISPKIICHEKT